MQTSIDLRLEGQALPNAGGVNHGAQVGVPRPTNRVILSLWPPPGGPLDVRGVLPVIPRRFLRPGLLPLHNSRWLTHSNVSLSGCTWAAVSPCDPIAGYYPQREHAKRPPSPSRHRLPGPARRLTHHSGREAAMGRHRHCRHCRCHPCPCRCPCPCLSWHWRTREAGVGSLATVARPMPLQGRGHCMWLLPSGVFAASCAGEGSSTSRH